MAELLEKVERDTDREEEMAERHQQSMRASGGKTDGCLVASIKMSLGNEP
jgi:hypothetical protein